MPIQPKQQPPYYTNAEPIKIYRALITQDATSAPTVKILENTLGNIVWTRQFPGVYLGTLTGQLPQNKTYYTITPNKGDSLVGITGYGIGYMTPPDDVAIVTMDITGTTADGYLFDTPIEITVY